MITWIIHSSSISTQVLWGTSLFEGRSLRNEGLYCECRDLKTFVVPAENENTGGVCHMGRPFPSLCHLTLSVLVPVGKTGVPNCSLQQVISHRGNICGTEISRWIRCRVSHQSSKPSNHTKSHSQPLFEV